MIRQLVSVEESLLLQPNEAILDKVSDQETRSWLLYRIGMGYFAARRSEEAQRCFERVSSSAPGSMGAALAQEQLAYLRENVQKEGSKP